VVVEDILRLADHLVRNIGEVVDPFCEHDFGKKITRSDSGRWL